MDFNQINKKITSNGYRRSGRRTEFDNDGNVCTIHDYECQKGYDMISVYADESDSVTAIEYTKVQLDRETRKFSQSVVKIGSMNELFKYIGA